MDQGTLKSLLHYDRASGVFRWLNSSGGRARRGSEAGCKRPDGYIKIRVNGRQFLAHRLAWLYEFGRMPDEIMDHINGDRSDNRIENLREASYSLNQQNKKIMSINTSGFVGVSRRSGSRWRAYITIDSKFISLGSFPTAEEASAAYLAAKRDHHKTASYIESRVRCDPANLPQAASQLEENLRKGEYKS